MSKILIQDTKDFLYQVQKNKNAKNANAGQLTNSKDLADRKNVLDLKIVVCVDISGSISVKQFQQFMRQIDAIRGLSMVKVIETDTEIVAMYDYFKVDKSKVMRLGGGGGTDFRSAFQAVEKMKPDAVLFCTDLCVHGNVPDPKIPVGWIATHDAGQNPFSFGKIVLKLPPPSKDN